MPIFGLRPQTPGYEPGSLIYLVVLGALPELGERPLARVDLPVEEVYEAALDALMWGVGLGIKFPMKQTGIFHQAYGDGSAEDKIKLCAEGWDRQSTEATRRGQPLTIEGLLPNHLVVQSAGPRVSASDSWLDVVTCFLTGLSGSVNRRDVVMSAVRAWCDQDFSADDRLAELQAAGDAVPAELVDPAPLDARDFEADAIADAIELVHTSETLFGST